jgi:hypothetical protein
MSLCISCISSSTSPLVFSISSTLFSISSICCNRNVTPRHSSNNNQHYILHLLDFVARIVQLSGKVDSSFLHPVLHPPLASLRRGHDCVPSRNAVLQIVHQNVLDFLQLAVPHLKAKITPDGSFPHKTITFMRWISAFMVPTSPS